MSQEVENDHPKTLVLGRALNSLHNREGVGATPRFRSAFPRKCLQFFDPIVGTNLNDGRVLAPSWYESTDFSDVFQNDESSVGSKFAKRTCNLRQPAMPSTHCLIPRKLVIS